MSAIARFTLMPAADLPGLCDAATPRKSLFGKPKDNFHAYLTSHGREVSDYPWSGYVFGALLVYLEQHGLNLMDSEYDELSTQLCNARGATYFIFTPAHKRELLAQLDPTGFSEAALRDYYNEFNEVEESHAGKPMLDGIRSIWQSLRALDDSSVIVFGVS
jgi:hypothetical protein